MNIIISLLGLAGMGDMPWVYFFLVPSFLTENHHSSVMVGVQGGGLVVLALIAARVLWSRKTEWHPRRLLILAGYPVFVVTTNGIGLAYNLW